MPHFIIEYSENLNDSIVEIMAGVSTAAESSGLFNSNDIKIRAVAYQHYQVGRADCSFIHVSSRMLSGRDSRQKSALTSAIVDQLSRLSFFNGPITAEVIDIHTESYAKLEL